MTINTPSPPDQAFIDAIKAAYDRGLSYDGVAQDLGINATKVQTIMRKYFPDSIRTPGETLEVRPQYSHAVHGLTLGALGLYAVGPCKKCRIEIVSKTPEEKGTITCPLCLDYAKRRNALKAPRRAA